MTIRQNISSVFKCDLPAPGGSAFDELNMPQKDAPTEIERRFAHLEQLTEGFTVGFNRDGRAITASSIREINRRNMVRVGEIVHANTLKPSNARGLQAFLAREAGIVHQWLGLGDNYTAAGWVRESLNRVRRQWAGGVNRALRDMGAMDTVAKLQADLVPKLQRVGLRQDQIDDIMVDAVELGFQPYIEASQVFATRASNAIRDKVNLFRERLLTQYNLPKDLAEQVLQDGATVARVYQQIAGVAQEAGVRLNEAPVWGYFNRVMSDEAKRRFNWRWTDQHNLEWNDGTPDDVSKTFMRSRRTADFIAEDEVILDYVFRSLGRSIHGDPTHYYRLASDTPGAGIGDIIDSRYGMAYAVVEGLQNDAPQVVEALIDNGVLSKIPWTTREVGEYIRNTLQFPFRNLREIFATDWVSGYRMYRTQLEHVMQESGFLTLLYRNAVEGNWGVTAAVRSNNPEMYRDYVKLSDMLPRGVQQRSMLPLGDGDVFVHPTVASLAAAQMELLTSPIGTNLVGRTIHYINRAFRRMALMTHSYFPRQVIQTFMSAGAAGGNLLYLSDDISKQFVHFLSRGFRTDADMYDNVRQVYRTRDGRMLTEQGLYNYLEDIGLIGRFEPKTGEAIRSQNYRSAVANQLRYLMHTFTKEGAVRTGEEVLGNVDDFIDRAFLPFAMMNTALQNAGVMSVARSLARRRSSNPMEYVLRSATLSTKRFEYVDDAIEHIRHYFFFYDDRNRIDNVAQHVIPFWAFTSRNVPATMRFIARHPSRFTAWGRAYQMANTPMYDDEYTTEGTIPEWTIHQQPLYFKVPGGRGDGRDAYFVVPFEPLDPIAAGLRPVVEAGDQLLGALGIWGSTHVESTRSRLSRAPWMDGTETNGFIPGLIDNMFPIWQAVANEIRGEVAPGIPLEEGATVDEFLGMRVSPGARMWWETLFPPLGYLNRSNPGNVFGTPPEYDIDTGLYTPGQPSWAGVPRSSRDTQKGNPYGSLDYLGVRVHPIDVYREMGLTYDTLSIYINEGEKYLGRMEDDLARIPEGTPLYQQRQADIERFRQLIEYARQDYIRLEDFAYSEGLSPRILYNRMTQRNISMEQLPVSPRERQ